AAAGGAEARGGGARARDAARRRATEARAAQAERETDGPQALTANGGGCREGALHADDAPRSGDRRHARARPERAAEPADDRAAIKAGDVYPILPVAEAKTRAIMPRAKAAKSGVAEKDAFAIEVVPVAHVSADEMVNILQPFVTPGGDVLSYPRANLLVITDLQSNIDRLRELITTFDSDVFHNLKTRVFKVQHGDPDELANEILGLLAPYGVTPTGEGEGGVYIVPLTRLNSLVAVAFDRAMFDEIEHWLHLLDIPPEEGAGRQTFVYNVENAKAEDLAGVLNELFGGGGVGGGGGLGGRAPGAAPAGIGLFGAGGVSGGRAGGLGGGRGGFGGAGGGGVGQVGGAINPQQVGGGGGAGGLGGAGRGTSL